MKKNLKYFVLIGALYLIAVSTSQASTHLVLQHVRQNLWQSGLSSNISDLDVLSTPLKMKSLQNNPDESAQQRQMPEELRIALELLEL